MILATSEPQATTATQTTNNPEVQAAEEEAKKQRDVEQRKHYLGKALFYWNRVLTVLLTLYAARGVWASVEFILVTNPELNEKLQLGLISVQEVNQLTAMAITLVITTIISVVLALRLHNVRRETGPTLDLIIAMLFLPLTPLLESLISMIDFVSLVGALF